MLVWFKAVNDEDITQSNNCSNLIVVQIVDYRLRRRQLESGRLNFPVLQHDWLQNHNTPPQYVSDNEYVTDLKRYDKQNKEHIYTTGGNCIDKFVN